MLPLFFSLKCFQTIKCLKWLKLQKRNWFESVSFQSKNAIKNPRDTAWSNSVGAREMVKNSYRSCYIIWATRQGVSYDKGQYNPDLIRTVVLPLVSPQLSGANHSCRSVAIFAPCPNPATAIEHQYIETIINYKSPRSFSTFVCVLTRKQIIRTWLGNFALGRQKQIKSCLVYWWWIQKMVTFCSLSWLWNTIINYKSSSEFPLPSPIIKAWLDCKKSWNTKEFHTGNDWGAERDRFPTSPPGPSSSAGIFIGTWTPLVSHINLQFYLSCFLDHWFWAQSEISQNDQQLEKKTTLASFFSPHHPHTLHFQEFTTKIPGSWLK